MSLHRYSVLAILKEMMLGAGMTSIISGSSVWKKNGSTAFAVLWVYEIAEHMREKSELIFTIMILKKM